MFDGIPDCIATQAAKDRAMAYWTDPGNFDTYKDEFDSIIERNFS